MCKKLKSNIALGNFVLQSIKHERREFGFEQIENFEKNLNEIFALNRCNTFAKIEISDLLEFEEENSNLVRICDEKIVIFDTEKENHYINLDKFFTFGLPIEIFNCIENASEQIIWDNYRG